MVCDQVPTVLSYSPLRVKWSNLPRSPQIFLRLFTENTYLLLTPVTIRKSHNTVKPHVTHEETMCSCKLYTTLPHSRIFLIRYIHDISCITLYNDLYIYVYEHDKQHMIM